MCSIPAPAIWICTAGPIGCRPTGSRACVGPARAGSAVQHPLRGADHGLAGRKETGQAAERRRVAGVFVNRRRRGMPLQTDPSVIYGLASTSTAVYIARIWTRTTPYNTYLRTGLPPTPIALPGQASIEAALNPEATRDLFFVARGDGTSEFLGHVGRASARQSTGSSAPGPRPLRPNRVVRSPIEPDARALHHFRRHRRQRQEHAADRHPRPRCGRPASMCWRRANPEARRWANRCARFCWDGRCRL